MWGILVGIPAGWLIASVKNPHRIQKVGGVAYSPDGEFLALATDEASVVLFEVATGKRQAVLDHGYRLDWSTFVVFNSRGLIALGGDSPEVKLWDLASRQLIRVRELLDERGIPDWSMKEHLVPDEQLLKMLDSGEMQEVTQFPFEVNDNIILFRRGTISRWGGTMSSSSDSLSIALKSGDLMGIGNDAVQVYLTRLESFPKIIFIRNGNTWIGAFHESGILLSSAARY
jgi:WD40 repeat protein